MENVILILGMIWLISVGFLAIKLLLPDRNKRRSRRGKLRK